MSEEMRTFGYLCPQCGKTVMGTRSVFALEASNAEVECACGKSALKVAFDGTEYHIYVPCGICGETHEAHCPPERVLHGATALGCAKTKQFCCFIGPEGTVEKNLRDLAVLAEYCLPFVRLGGRFFALKGPACEEELERAVSAIALLGGEVVGVHPQTLPDGSSRNIVEVKKISQTPTKYPRNAGKIKKNPL